MSTTKAADNWSLEVVRGREAGRRYALPAGWGEVVLGNAPGVGPTIDLSDQEANSPRRMAARQARLERAAGDRLALRDLGSPGGTFVNQQRITPGEPRPLAIGDLIQLGGVQLRVVASNGPAAPPAAAKPTTTAAPARPAGPVAINFTIKAGTTCRSLDDFLAVAAQRWGDLRDELTSGRLGAYFAGIGRPELVPAPDAPGSPDDRLDAWIGALPTTRPGRAEMDVHPARIAVKATPGGGTTRRKVRVTNTGVRLLRLSARIEPAASPSAKLGPEFPTGRFSTVETTEIPIDVLLPDGDGPTAPAWLVLEGNAGERRVEIVVEPPADCEAVPGGSVIADGPPPSESWLSKISTSHRMIAGAALFGGGRLAVAINAWTGLSTGLAVAAGLLAIAGAVLGFVAARRRGGWADAPAGGFAGAIGGLIAAAVLHGLFRSVEPAVVASGPAALLAALAWSWIGAGVGWLSTLVVTSSYAPESNR